MSCFMYLQLNVKTKCFFFSCIKFLQAGLHAIVWVVWVQHDGISNSIISQLFSLNKALNCLISHCHVIAIVI